MSGPRLAWHLYVHECSLWMCLCKAMAVKKRCLDVQEHLREIVLTLTGSMWCGSARVLAFS